MVNIVFFTFSIPCIMIQLAQCKPRNNIYYCVSDELCAFVVSSRTSVVYKIASGCSAKCNAENINK